MAQTIDKLLNLAADKADQVLQHLQSNPHLASQQDHHGYSLLHAAASYNHPELLQTLLSTYSVNPNLVDEDDETCLFSVETLDMAKFLVEQCNVDTTHKNAEGQTAAEKFEQEGDYPEVAQYLAGLQAGAGTVAPGEETNGAVPPPPLPHGVKIDLGTMAEDEVGEAPDPEFRRRIEELAARPDFQSEEVQQQLRELVQDALGGMKGDDREVRQRLS
ncbi:uncharacterized protein M437DRAFT_57658 [Aureobasidium melanogenum CBS 110374]|uniref:Ankyrin repeat protein n=1 Tax=Aureobasidium melanogenum (strain CBS 110374) TaxID=1043003 RepID=A0A074W934_AURM1|nr:uncharacterized protein M437DRAFT_57658 [Aureobasidium melanogenum CBS 110374]KEQ59051.1 hypothetical protein M437DRAFT_57658 [Aureobasidium melanogenum CBS 110374]